MRARRTTTFVIIALMALTALLPTGGSGRDAWAQGSVNLAFATLDTGSAWYVYGATMAELLRKTLPPGSNIDVKPRAGGVGNPRLVAKNETPLGFAFTVTNRWAWDGKEAYDTKLDNLRGLVGGFDTYYLVAVTAKKLGINSIKDIRDKKIPIKMVTQPVGSLGEFAGRQLLRAYGLTYNDIKAWGGSTQHVGYNVIVDAFKDGRADVLVRRDHAEAPLGERDRLGRGREVPGAGTGRGDDAGAPWLCARHHARRHVQGPGRSGEDSWLPHGPHHQQGAAGTGRLHGDQDSHREQGCPRAGPRGARRVRSQDGLAAGQGWPAPASGRRARVPREGVDEIAADWILQNGRLITLDSRRPTATALAIAGGRIVAIGGRADVRGWHGRRTRVVDLAGASVIPGLVDAHAHLDREGLKYVFPTLERCRSIVEIQGAIHRLAAQRPPGEWIVTMPVGVPPFYLDPPAGLAEGRWPTRADLDRAAPHHPVYIRGIWGYWNKPPVHSIANSLALARAGIGRDTAAPPGIEIVKDAAGEPTGLFVEHNLIQVIEFTLMQGAPRFTHDDRVRALRESLSRYAARGVTAVYEGHGIAPEVLRVYRETHEARRLSLRCTLALSPTWNTLAEAERAIPEIAAWAGGRGTGDDRLRLAGICLHYGGDADVARILHAEQPYTAWAGFRGECERAG